MIELDATGWCVVLAAAMLIGITKTGIPGLGILAIILLANAMPARLSTGLVLPVLIVGDLFAVAYYRRHAVWRHLGRLLPWALAGILPGYVLLGHLSEAQFRPIIGGIALVLIVLQRLQAWHGKEPPRFVQSWWFAAILGVLAGITTMMANAAGPIMVVYLLAMRLPKTEFVGTGAWYYLIVNVVKLPFSADLGLINPASLRINLHMAPMVIVGALLGILILQRVPQKVFNAVAELLAAAAALRLLLAG